MENENSAVGRTLPKMDFMAKRIRFQWMVLTCFTDNPYVYEKSLSTNQCDCMPNSENLIAWS